MITKSARLPLALAALVALACAVGAQPVPKEKGPARTVGMFNFYCLSRLPDLQSIERTAGLGEYDQLTGKDLAPYAPDAGAEQLHAWRFHEHGEAFVLAAYRAPQNDELKSAAPKFAGVQSVACTLHIPAGAAEGILAELTRLLGRPPDKTLNGAQNEYVWTRQTGKLFSQVRFSAAADAGHSAALSSVILLKG
jgi:hypothetical protein